jgi:hypothetical protein
MPNPQPFEERYQRGVKGCGSVPLDKDHVRAEVLDHTPHAVQAAVGQIVKVLPLLHDVEVVVGDEIKRVQDLVYHVGMLAREGEAALQ